MKQDRTRETIHPAHHGIMLAGAATLQALRQAYAGNMADAADWSMLAACVSGVEPRLIALDTDRGALKLSGELV